MKSDESYRNVIRRTAAQVSAHLRLLEEYCKKSLTISIVNFGWTSVQKVVHHKSKYSPRCLYSCGGFAFLVTGSKLMSHGFNWPIKWRIFTLSPYLYESRTNGVIRIDAIQREKRMSQITVWMPEDKSSMLSSTCCRWMANASRYPCAPNRKSTSSTTLGRRRQNCLFGWQIVSTSRMFHGLDGRRTRPSWNNLASQHLGQPTILRVRIIRRNFAAPIIIIN